MSSAYGTLEVRSTTRDGRVWVTVRGDVDMRSSPLLRSQLLEAAGQSPGPMAVDLSGVEHMDSSGIGTMVFVKRELERAGRKLILVGLRPRVRGVLEITHLDRFFTIAQHEEEAMRS